MNKFKIGDLVTFGTCRSEMYVNKNIDEKNFLEVFETITKTIDDERKKAYGYDGFVGGVIHLDEKSPHLHLFFVNIEKESDKSKISNRAEIKYSDMRDIIVKKINNIEFIKANENLKLSPNDRSKNNHE